MLLLLLLLLFYASEPCSGDGILILYVYFRCCAPRWMVITGDILTLRNAERCYVTRAGESVVFMVVLTQLLVVALLI